MSKEMPCEKGLGVGSRERGPRNKRLMPCSCQITQALPLPVPAFLAFAFAAASLELSVSDVCAVLCLRDTPAADSQNSPVSAS